MLTSFAGGTLFGTRSTDDPTVLGLHGWGGSATQLAGALAPFPNVLLDLPGFGRSPEPPEAWGAAEYAEAILPVLQEFNSPPIVVGYSFGGRIAVHLAAAHPELVGGLVLTGAPLLRPSAKAKASLVFRALRKANQLGLVSDEQMEAQRRKRGSTDYRNASGVMRAVLVKAVNETYEEQLAKVKCHVEMVWGNEDTAAPVDLAKAAAAMISNANLVVVEGRTHFLPTEEPEAIVAAVERCR